MIAILGSTSHIAKNLIERFNHKNLYLFSRSRGNLDSFIDGYYDIIINCIGVGTPVKLKEIGSKIFLLTEYWDNLILDYLNNYGGKYINFSSGIVDGSAWGTKHNYKIAKLYSEAKHRTSNLNIIDLRLFAFFSRHIDMNSGYFITELINCIKEGREFLTGDNNIVRDYVHPDDLFNLVKLCITLKLNDEIDVYSLKPVTKFEILDYFKTTYGLKYRIIPGTIKGYASGTEDNYFSKNHKADLLGYKPKYSAMDSIIEESRVLLENRK